MSGRFRITKQDANTTHLLLRCNMCIHLCPPRLDKWGMFGLKCREYCGIDWQANFAGQEGTRASSGQQDRAAE